MVLTGAAVAEADDDSLSSQTKQLHKQADCAWCSQVLLLLRQMECTGSQAAASKVSLLMLGQQAVIDAYLCLLHLTTGKPPSPPFTLLCSQLWELADSCHQAANSKSTCICKCLKPWYVCYLCNSCRFCGGAFVQRLCHSLIL